MIILINIVLLIILSFTKLILDNKLARIFLVIGLAVVIILQTVLASKITNRIRSNVRRENIDFYLELSNLIEREFNEYIVKKEVVDKDFAEYKFHFKSDCVEFTLWFDEDFIAYLDTYSKLNHYHFSSWEHEKSNIDSIIKEMKELLNGDYLFGDILFNNNKIANTFYINLKETEPSISKDLNSILDDFFDELVFRKDEYKLKIYGSKRFGYIELIWKRGQ
jgi:hypothetical protein